MGAHAVGVNRFPPYVRETKGPDALGGIASVERRRSFLTVETCQCPPPLHAYIPSPSRIGIALPIALALETGEGRRYTVSQKEITHSNS